MIAPALISGGLGPGRALLAGITLVGTDTTSPYAFRWHTTPRTGSVTLRLRA